MPVTHLEIAAGRLMFYTETRLIHNTKSFFKGTKYFNLIDGFCMKGRHVTGKIKGSKLK